MRGVAKQDSLIGTLVKNYSLQLNFYNSCNMSFEVMIINGKLDIQCGIEVLVGFF